MRVFVLRRINFDTGYPYRMGDFCKDRNMFFRCYRKSRILKNGFYSEFWLSKEAFDNFIKSQKRASKKIYKNRFSKNREYVNTYKLSSGCHVCGYNKHHAALDFDHIDRHSKKFNIASRVLSLSLESLKLEMSKCKVICANCHREKSFICGDNKPIKEIKHIDKSVYSKGVRHSSGYSVLTAPNNKSGVKNVYLNKNGRYTVRVAIDGNRVSLGVFDNIFDACCLAIKVATKNGVEGLRKSQWYLDKLISVL